MIRKLKTKGGRTTWAVQARDAQGSQRNRRFRTEREAKQYDRDLGNEREKGRNGERFNFENPTLREWIDLFLSSHRASPQTKRTLSDRLLVARKSFLGEMRLRDLDWAHIGRWVNEELDEYAPTTQRALLKALRQVLGRAVKEGILRMNPASEVSLPELTRRSMLPFTSWDEVEAVATAAGGHHGEMIRFGAATGLRPQELFALRWSDINRETRTLTIRRTVQNGRVVEGTAKTKGSLRPVRLTQRALEALPRAEGSPNEYIFAGPNGDYLNLHNWRCRVWYPALEAAGLTKRGPSQLRHTFATLAITEAPVPIQYVSRQLGHANISTTQSHYLAWMEGQDDHLLDLLDQAAGKRLRVVEGVA